MRFQTLISRNSAFLRLWITTAIAFVSLAGPGARSALADGGHWQDPMALTIDAWDGTRHGQFVITPTMGSTDGHGHWWYSLGAPQVISDAQGVPLVTFDQLTMDVLFDPQIALNFFATAGNANTTITMNSGVAVFAPILNPSASAGASLTLTDNDGNGGFTNGLFPGPKSYTSIYNGASVFANLVNDLSVSPPPLSTSGSENAGPSILGGSVSSIQSQYNFVLSANDAASGTSLFRVVPEPGTMALLAVGLLALRLRRR